MLAFFLGCGRIVNACDGQDVRIAGGVWLSLVERYVRDVEVAGSNPVTPIVVFLISRVTSAHAERLLATND